MLKMYIQMSEISTMKGRSVKDLRSGLILMVDDRTTSSKGTSSRICSLEQAVASRYLLTPEVVVSAHGIMNIRDVT